MTTRTNEIVNSIHSFSRDGYSKNEYLPELLKLQKEIVNLTFGSDAKDDMTLWNTVGKLNQLNKENGNTAEAEATRFHDDVAIIINQIKAEKSGSFGEYKAFRSLETLMCKHRVLKNVSLMHGNHRTELDAIVLTSKAIFIVEVKNTRRDIHIDDQGNYYRVGKYGNNFDKNIGENMNDKVYLLKTALENAGIKDIKIESLVVFTNYKIKVNNEYPYIKTCFLSNLPKIIESYQGPKVYSNDDFDALEKAIANMTVEDLFNCPVDIEAFRNNYAVLVIKIEDAMNNPKIQRANRINSFFRKIQKMAASAAMFCFGA